MGGIAGAIGAAFFAALEFAQRIGLERLAGYAPVRALGETFMAEESIGTLRLWALVLLPAVGGLLSGVLTSRFAPECAGGGGDAIIASYHHGGLVRRRVVPVKALAAIATLGTGGAGGREGPTMQIGGAIGAWVARWVPANSRERRILIVSGIAAGIAAVFRTPLGAALLATEMLYRDDFESDALVPAVLASVIAYAIVISVFGETTLFGHRSRFPFIPSHLVLYATLALAIALAAVCFLKCLRAVHGVAARSRLPVWLRPAAGGLLTGALGAALVAFMLRYFGPAGARLGVFGGGYGVAQVAITGADGLPGGWKLVGLLALLFVAKLVASSFTIGSGGAAGDFAPSLVMGGLVGSAFGHAAGLALHDPRIDPAAFALVGMGTFYGGVAHTPLAALVLVSELAGSYDLLVPMMLAVSVAYVALRRWTLYEAQPATKADSPRRHSSMRRAPIRALDLLRVSDVLVAPELDPIERGTPLREILRLGHCADRQAVLTVVAAGGKPAGIVDVELARAVSDADHAWVVADDLSVPLAAVRPESDLIEVSALLQDRGLAQVPVIDGDAVVGYVGETELARALIALRRSTP